MRFAIRFGNPEQPHLLILRERHLIDLSYDIHSRKILLTPYTFPNRGQLYLVSKVKRTHVAVLRKMNLLRCCLSQEF